MLPPLLALPSWSLVALAALLAKLWGMVAHLPRARRGAARAAIARRRVLALHAAVFGVLLLGALKFVPYAGVWASGAPRRWSASAPRCAPSSAAASPGSSATRLAAALSRP